MVAPCVINYFTEEQIKITTVKTYALIKINYLTKRAKSALTAFNLHDFVWADIEGQNKKSAYHDRRGVQY